MAYVNWFNRMERPLPDSETLEKVKLPSNDPQLACLLAAELENKEVTSVVGVMVDTDGTVVGEPELLSTGGYGIFGEEAIAIARAHTFDNPTDADQPYLVEVTFTYNRDACIPAP